MLEVHRAPHKLIALWLATIGMTVAAYWWTTMPNGRAITVGWAALVFFGFGALVLPFQFLKTGPVIILNQVGIEDRRSGIGVVPWEQVVRIERRYIRSQPLLYFELIDEEQYLSRISSWRRTIAGISRQMGFPFLTISATGLDHGLDEIEAFAIAQMQFRQARSSDAAGQK